ncbi:MAG: DNA methyltransferase [Candidatus Peribacteraceae bacterium]|nr:DNA methyltransferase [Candidatus Peribacteraceae bacterium]
MTKLTITTGNIIGIGTHRIACGDCRDATLLRRLFGDEQTSLVLCDPPYGVQYVEGKDGLTGSKTRHKPITNDHFQTDSEYSAFTKAWLEAVKLHLTKKNALYCFNSDKMIFALREGIVAAGWKFAQLLIWAKTQAVLGRMDYAIAHELIGYGWFGTHEFMKSKDKTLLVYPKPNKSVLHSTMKPVGLLRRLILNSSRINDVVYDGFLGSGSTLIAAEHTKRRCFGVEISPEYCSVIAARYEKLTDEKAVLLSPTTI